MKLILAIVLAAVAIGFPNEIAKINHHKSEAQKSYLEGNYQAAIEHYGILIDSFQVDEEEILHELCECGIFNDQKQRFTCPGNRGSG